MRIGIAIDQHNWKRYLLPHRLKVGRKRGVYRWLIWVWS